MLINFTNHPVNKWQDIQFQAAEEQFGNIVDLEFPNIDPAWDHHQIEELAEEYLQQIRSKVRNKNDAVLIMGEQTFCFSLICKLQKNGIVCYATTTQRNVSEKTNKKISTFEFIGFRKYNVCM